MIYNDIERGHARDNERLRRRKREFEKNKECVGKTMKGKTWRDIYIYMFIHREINNAVN